MTPLKCFKFGQQRLKGSSIGIPVYHTYSICAYSLFSANKKSLMDQARFVCAHPFHSGSQCQQSDTCHCCIVFQFTCLVHGQGLLCTFDRRLFPRIFKKNLSIEEFLVLSQLISFSRANGVLNCRFIKLASCTFRTSSILDRMLHIIESLWMRCHKLVQYWKWMCGS